MGGNIPGENFVGIFQGGFTGAEGGGSLMGENFPGGSFPRGDFPRTMKYTFVFVSRDIAL